MEVSGQLHAVAALPRGKSLRWMIDSLDRINRGPHSAPGRGGKEKTCLESSPDRPARSQSLY